LDHLHQQSLFCWWPDSAASGTFSGLFFSSLRFVSSRITSCLHYLWVTASDCTPCWLFLGCWREARLREFQEPSYLCLCLRHFGSFTDRCGEDIHLPCRNSIRGSALPPCGCLKAQQFHILQFAGIATEPAGRLNSRGKFCCHISRSPARRLMAALFLRYNYIL
jgi:hypothetical protein